MLKSEEEQYLISFGKNVKNFRKISRMSLVDLEETSGIDDGDISRIEHGKKNVTLLTIVKLSRGLQVPAAALMPC